MQECTGKIYALCQKYSLYLAVLFTVPAMGEAADMTGVTLIANFCHNSKLCQIGRSVMAQGQPSPANLYDILKKIYIVRISTFLLFNLFFF